MSASEVFRVEVRGPVIAGFMNRPHCHNALDSALRSALIEFWERVRDDPTVAAAIIAGEPGTSFSSGRDLKETAAAYREDQSGADWELSDQTGYPFDSPPGKPLLAAIDRYCMGAGLKLAAECDLRICTPEAVFASPQAKVGRATESPLYLRRVGLPLAVALDMVLTGRRLDAEEARHFGLVSRVVPRQQLLEEAWGVAARIAECSPMVISGLKRGLDAGLLELPAAMGSPLWKMVTGMYGDTSDAREGAEAFRQKRDPDYS